MEEYTISVVNGKQVAQGHNRRDPEAIKRQDHIQRGGEFEIWYDESLYRAYHRLFDESVKEYNEEQIAKGRKNRTISNYLSKIKNSKQQNPVYEDIITVGNCKDNKIYDFIKKQILHEYLDEWQARNPNFILIGAYYHADERDPQTGLYGAPHLHIDYIPVAHNCSKGPRIGTSVTGALKEMGFVTYKAKYTAQMQWQDREREILKKLCKEHGFDVAAPKKEKRKHQATAIYKAEQKAKDRLQLTEQQLQETEKQLEETAKQLQETEDYISDAWGELDKKLVSHGLSAKEIEKITITETYDSNLEVPLTDYINLKMTAKTAEEEREKAKREAEERTRLEFENQMLIQKLNLMQYEYERLKEDDEKHRKAMGAYEKTIEAADSDLAEMAINNYFAAYCGESAPVQTRNHDEEIEL